MPIPVAAQVQNGGTAQIVLRVYGRQEQATRFLVRKEPALGKIVSLEPVEREVWILTYQHTSSMNGQLSLQDRILFAAQNKNGTSSAAEIALTIVDNPPELAAPGVVEFGEIAAGIASSRTLSIGNKGGGVLEGSVTVDAPWSVEPASYKLERGQQAALRLTIAPDAEREYQGHLHFSSDSKMEPALRALAVAPFSAGPAVLELTGAAKKAARSASFTLTNNTGAELTLQVEANARLHLPDRIVLPPKAATTLSPTLADDDAAGMEASIRLSLGAVSRKINVHAESLAMEAEPTPPPPPHAAATPTPASVASYPGFFPSPLPAAAPKAGATPGATPVALAANDKTDSTNLDGLLKITSIAMVQATSAGTAEFAWEPPLLPASAGTCTYRLEVRRLALDANHKLLQRWIAVPDVQFASKENRMTGFVTGIPPGITDTIRVVALTASGVPCAVSPPLGFHIPAPFQIFTLRNGLLAGFVVMLLSALALHFIGKREK
ncbi:MAG: hypothetical protein WCO68_05470 [Verrucomicrobiota bacterium]